MCRDFGSSVHAGHVERLLLPGAGRWALQDWAQRAPDHHQGHAHLGEVAAKHPRWCWERVLSLTSLETTALRAPPTLGSEAQPQAGAGAQLVSPNPQPSFQTFLHLSGNIWPLRFIWERL